MQPFPRGPAAFSASSLASRERVEGFAASRPLISVTDMGQACFEASRLSRI
jgi:hypothetical protein